MGEIVFSLFIGGCLVFVGSLLNYHLLKEQKNLSTTINKKRQKI
ncbi:hypothetical protein [Malaciobacter marinus]|nr:hypothetical protein [Malaciobacter marinus]